MRKAALYAFAAVGVLGLAATRLKSSTIAPEGFDLSGFDVGQQIRDLAALGNRPINPGANPVTVSAPGIVTQTVTNRSQKLSRSQAVLLARSLDVSLFAGWFSQGGRDIRDVVAIWIKESNLRPDATNLNDPNGGAWGIGQVLARTAASYGFTPPESLLDAETGAIASMTHLRALWDDLSGRLGHDPSIAQWVKAYNAGAAGLLVNGVNPVTYYADWAVRRALL